MQKDENQTALTLETTQRFHPQLNKENTHRDTAVTLLRFHYGSQALNDDENFDT